MRSARFLTILFASLVFISYIDARKAMSFCSGGCNHYIVCSVEIYDENLTLMDEKSYGQRAVDGNGKDCNIFGCDCDRCAPEYTNDSYYVRWCRRNYGKDAQDFFKTFLCSKSCNGTNPADCKYSYQIFMRHRDSGGWPVTIGSPSGYAFSNGEKCPK